MLTSKLAVPDAPCHFDLEERRPILSEKHRDTIWAIENLANTLGALGPVDEAISSLELTGGKMRLQVVTYKDL